MIKTKYYSIMTDLSKRGKRSGGGRRLLMRRKEKIACTFPVPSEYNGQMEGDESCILFLSFRPRLTFL